MPPENASFSIRIDAFLSPPSPPLTLHFIDITYRIKITSAKSGNSVCLTDMLPSQAPPSEDRTILDGITGTAVAGELLAVLGPSGSGKSTLLTILAGRLKTSHGGAVLANGRRATRSVFRRIGYVPQDDVLYPHLTVRETLTYCAMLRLPREQVRPAVEAVMGELGLNGCADTVVGGAFVRGVSGGERKRVAIGHEMLVNPSAVVLDEPTSGLDATAAGRMVATLVGMARKGRAVVASVHQPASRVYQMFDSVLLLDSGRCMYFGKGRDAVNYFAYVGFSPEPYVNPADFMLDLSNGVTRIDCEIDAGEKSRVKKALISSYTAVLAPAVKAAVNASIAASITCTESAATGTERSVEKNAKDFTKPSWFTQFSVLLHRSLKERRHETFNSLRVFQVLAAACLAGFLWWGSSIQNVQDRLGLLFFISIFWGVFASFNAVFTFPQERVIFIKERASGMYSLSPYFLARTAGDLPMELILPTVFLLVVYWMASLRHELSAFVLTIIVVLSYVLVAQGLGLTIGAVMMDAKKASTVVTVTMLAFLLTGGFYVEKVPLCMRWLKYLSFTFHCYKLLISVQYRGTEIRTYEAFLASHEMEEQETVAMNVIALIIMFFGYRILAYSALRRIKL